MPRKTTKEAPLLAHPFIGKRVVCDVTEDKNTGRKPCTVSGPLTSYDATVLRIDKVWWFTASTRNLKEV